MIWTVATGIGRWLASTRLTPEAEQSEPGKSSYGPSIPLLEPLEPRVLLSATSTAVLQDIEFQAGGNIPAVNLNSFFDDPDIQGSVVKAETNRGDIFIETFDTTAPNTTQNFLNLVNNGDYENMFYHRSVANFVLQGGGFTISNDGQDVSTVDAPTIDNEFGNFADQTGSNAQIAQGSTVIQLPNGTDLSSVQSNWTITLVSPNHPDNFVIVGVSSVDDANDTVTVDSTFEYVEQSGSGMDLTSNSNDLQAPIGSDLSQIQVGSTIRLINPITGGFADRTITAIDDVNDTVTYGGDAFTFDFPGLNWQIMPVNATADWRLTPPVNVAGTISMAKLGGDPDSATTQFFYNLIDNSNNLDQQNGGFTPLGKLLFDGLQTVRDISNDNTFNLTTDFTANSGALTDVPLRNYQNSDGKPDVDDYVLTQTMSQVDELAFTVVGNTNPTLIDASVNSNGELVLTPAANTVGSSDITVRATDLEGNFVEQTFTVQTAANTDPSLSPDQVRTDEDTPVNIDVLANDTDADGDTLTVTSVGTPTFGSVVINSDNTLTYTPSANASGIALFTYTVEDGAGGSAIQSVSVTVDPVNDSPVGVNDAATTDEDTPVTIDVLTNDTDVENDTLSVASVTQPANGTVVINGDGTITYTPNADYNGNDSFTYITQDDKGAASDPVTVDVTIDALPDDPIAAADAATTQVDQAKTIAVLDNDSDVDGDTLAVESVTQPANGNVVINVDGTITYTPNAGYVGDDSFTYTINDGTGRTSAAQTVALTVTPANGVAIRALSKKVKENKGKLKFRVTRTGDQSQSASVKLKFGGKAKFKKDYTVKATGGAKIKGKRLILPPGRDAVTLVIKPKNDKLKERTESLSISLTGSNILPLALAQFGDRAGTAKAKIQDDD